MIHLELIISENCCACERAKGELLKFTKGKNNISFKAFNRNASVYNTTIVPSLFIEGKLFAYGELDFEKINSRIKVLNTLN